MAKFVGLFLFTRTVEGAPLRAVVHRRSGMRSENQDSQRKPFAWGLQPLSRGPLKANENPLDSLFAAITMMFDTADIMPEQDEEAIVLSKPSDRMLIYGWQLPWEEVLALRIGACTGSVTNIFKKQASEITPVSLTDRDSIDARIHDTMLRQERLALMRGFKIFG